MRVRWMLVAALVLLMSGCSGNKKTDREKVTQQWRDARAGVLYSLARDQYQNGNFAECRKSVNDALALSPQNVNIRILSARLAIEQGQLEVAEKELITARAIDPKNAEADYLSGVVYQRWQRPETAFHCYSLAVEKAPSELAYVLARSEMLVAMGRQAEGLAALRDKLVYFEHSPVIRDAVGQLLVQQKKYREGADTLRQATILAPDEPTYREHLAMALFLDGNFREAQEQVQRYIDLPAYAKRADAWVILGECQMNLGNPRAARSSFDTATQKDEHFAPAWLSLARATLQLGDLRRSDMAARKALALEPENGEVHLLIGYLRLKTGLKDEALSSFRKAAALQQSDPVSLCMIGYTLERMGQGAMAIRYYAQALKVRPGDEMATRLLSAAEVKE